ncbi:putative abc [Phaeomoniella chlamydospora]|uniref:Putative abc n=1 Tax=Phaeomoniella chlamydospora TaxID=158046 RepID=A0A0G2EK86_PHACM|nr:putative abc [Phaeomoniella chlamydospora]
MTTPQAGDPANPQPGVPAPIIPAAAGEGVGQLFNLDSHRAGDHRPGTTATTTLTENSSESEDNQKLRDNEVHELARRLTRESSRRHSTLGPSGFQIPFSGVEKDSLLDPNGPNFSAKAWARNLVAVTSRDPERYPRRTAGISFKNLNAHGFGTPTDYQKDVGNIWLQAGAAVRALSGTGKTKIQILQGFDGYVEPGEMLVVLGRPGSGCSTLLKTIAGETHGFVVGDASSINYQGISAKQMHNQFRGEAIYMAETDVHFPQLTVGQTLAFAAKARAPRDHLYPDVTKEMYAEHMRDVMMAMFGISHTINTRVGNDFVRGVSGGERKRVSISEAALSGSPLQCWDNSTRGLDSANAIEFCKTLRLSTELMGATACVAIYQAPQSAYDVFDKVTVLYEGRQIYFGPIHEAKAFFTNMGFECPPRQTTPDFLTSLTSPEERIVKAGYENKTPRTPDEFVQAWKNSPEYARLMQNIEAFDQKYPIGGESLKQFEASRRAQQAKSQRIKSPYTLSVSEQIQLCVGRGFQRLRQDMSLTLSGLIGNTIMGFIIASIFYDLADNTSSFYSRGALLFFAVLLNGFASALEILTLYAQRPIVEKHTRYALYHPFAEAISSMICDLPYKITNAILFNLVLYFMTNLRREPGAFFTFFLFSFVTTLVMSMIFRTIAATSRSLSQALCPAALIILALVIYTGFVVPPKDMLGWSRWINYIDPVGYAFESLMVNEFAGRTFDCSSFVPSGGSYDSVPALSKICSTVGAVAGSSVVSGTTYIQESFSYQPSHKWRNLGILIAFTLFFMFTYLFATEYISEQKSKGEVLLFRRGYQPKRPKGLDEEGARAITGKEESGDDLDRQVTATIEKQTAIFSWSDICYDIKIKGEPRRILDNVDGWVKPGTLTALMGPSGAGKTTLLDVLATRVTMGVVSGEALVDGRQRDTSFQRKTGYVQQQDLHLATSTVRESLTFSALMRQPAYVPRKEKIAYVDEVIKLLGMEAYADAVVGVPGEGLNVEQRKRLTIGVELAAKPQLLLFLDEPTSGLDSQTSWSILDLLEKLTRHGQAILCTIHQPSAVLFQRFDRLLFLAPGGKTVYFGDIGDHSKILTSYFERNGAEPCPDEENPAEWMMATIGCAPGAHSEIDWPVVWRDSAERAEVKRELAEMKAELGSRPTDQSKNPADYREFAAPFGLQLWEVFKRVNAQYWRTPSYIYSKTALCLITALFIGFTFFKAQLSLQGLQNQMFAIFMLFIVFGNLLQQILPQFVTQRSLYEARERPAKTYSWKVFMMSNILVELPWQTVMAALMYFTWYYPIGLYENTGDSVHIRGFLMFLFIWTFLLWTSTMGHMLIAGIDLAETAANIGNLLFSLCLVFCGVLATPSQMPHFWIFMYRVSPLTYLVSGVLSVGLTDKAVTCSSTEILRFEPALDNQTCGEYMSPYMSVAGGYLLDSSATTNCGYCSYSTTNTFLASISANYSDRWRNFGLLFVFIIFNIAMAVFIYWLARVPKKNNTVKEEPGHGGLLSLSRTQTQKEKENKEPNEK